MTNKRYVKLYTMIIAFVFYGGMLLLSAVNLTLVARNYYKKEERENPNKEIVDLTWYSQILKNPVLTVSYNFLWKNDSDWKYFVYYNSLFFSEFEDFSVVCFPKVCDINI